MRILPSESPSLAVYVGGSIDAGGGNLELANTQAWEYVGSRLLSWGVGVARRVGPLRILRYLRHNHRRPHRFFLVQKGKYPLPTCIPLTHRQVDQVRRPFLPMGRYHLAGSERQFRL